MKPVSEFVELSKADHNRSSFRCGKPELDDFLKNQALRHRKLGVSLTQVLPALMPDSHDKSGINAFYTISPSLILRETLPAKMAKKLPQYPVPVSLIAQLGVHIDMQGSGLGGVTLVECLKYLYGISKSYAAVGVVVDCLDADARNFYQHYGFKFLCKHQGKDRLYLPMGTVAQLY